MAKKGLYANIHVLELRRVLVKKCEKKAKQEDH